MTHRSLCPQLMKTLSPVALLLLLAALVSPASAAPAPHLQTIGYDSISNDARYTDVLADGGAGQEGTAEHRHGSVAGEHDQGHREADEQREPDAEAEEELLALLVGDGGPDHQTSPAVDTCMPTKRHRPSSEGFPSPSRRSSVPLQRVSNS